MHPLENFLYAGCVSVYIAHDDLVGNKKIMRGDKIGKRRRKDGGGPGVKCSPLPGLLNIPSF